MSATAGALGDFLRARREQLRPEDVGLNSGPRRRVPGLRREELATLAGISVDYYLRLEQGRDGNRPSSCTDRHSCDTAERPRTDALTLAVWRSQGSSPCSSTGSISASMSRSHRRERPPKPLPQHRRSIVSSGCGRRPAHPASSRRRKRTVGSELYWRKSQAHSTTAMPRCLDPAPNVKRCNGFGRGSAAADTRGIVGHHR